MWRLPNRLNQISLSCSTGTDRSGSRKLYPRWDVLLSTERRDSDKFSDRDLDHRRQYLFLKHPAFVSQHQTLSDVNSLIRDTSIRHRRLAIKLLRIALAV